MNFERVTGRVSIGPLVEKKKPGRPRTSVRQRVLEALRGCELRQGQVITRCRACRNSVLEVLRDMEERGQLIKKGRGVRGDPLLYQLPSNGKIVY